MSATAVSIIQPLYIVVDLDGTLVLTDTFVATLLETIRTHPLRLFAILLALLRSRAESKRLAASSGLLKVASLPYNEALIGYLREQKAAGRRIVLATGADSVIASDVAAHLGIFDEVISSYGRRNVTGTEKLIAIRERIGDSPFVYAGNSRADLKIWRHSQAAILVGAPRSCERELRQAGIPIQREAGSDRANWKTLFRCLRVHQWAKNMLVFLPVVLAHQIRNPLVMTKAFIAFLAWSLCASALYIINDLLDLQADRLHPRKRARPFASGAVSPQAGISIAFLAGLGASLLALLLPGPGRVLLAGYALSSLCYSLKLKRLLFIDVVTLALFYTLRVLYGGAVTEIRISVWTLAFAIFLFTSLATVKRLTELRKANSTGGNPSDYRGYKAADATQLSSLASSAGYVAVLVLALYINSPEVNVLYRHPQGLWLLCPALIYWISRLTLIANRGQLDDDPVSFALKDRATLAVGAGAAIVILLSA
jgi:4-hydroxybenzoate polyprenyltransferase